MIDFQKMRRLIPAEKRLWEALQTTGSADTHAALAETHDRIRAALEDQREELREILKTWEAPGNGNIQTFLEFRYLQGLPAREIASALNYSEQYVFRILKRGEHIVEQEEKP